MRLLILIISLLYISSFSFGSDRIVVFEDASQEMHIGAKIDLYEDKTNALGINDIISGKGVTFYPNDKQVANFEITNSTHWLRVIIKNNSEREKLLLELPYPTIDSVSFYSLDTIGNLASELHTGEFVPFFERNYRHQNYIFELLIKKGETKTYFMRVNSHEQMQVPLVLGTREILVESLLTKDLIFGVYAGIIFVMFFYNLFLFFSVKDKTYIYYVAYIFFVGLTQACVQGYATRFLWPNSPYLANFMMVLIPAMVGVTALEFIKNFLQVKKMTPTLYKVFFYISINYIVIILLGAFKFFRLSAGLVQINAMLASLFVLFVGYRILILGFRPALFFLVSWSIFLLGVIVFVLRNFDFLAYNNFTYYALQIGSGLEVVLLSFALADRINILKKEKDDSQREAFEALQENDRLLKAQNVILDHKVKERTKELELSNTNLEQALVDLKGTQAQLVNAEKMASLGQLTAGVAHEINNPINFVSSSIKPLKRDVQDIISILDAYKDINAGNLEVRLKEIQELKEELDIDYVKDEIDSLLKGIEDGASRTSQIVMGLKTFSRIDETDLKKVDLNEGLDSTLVILNSEIRDKVRIDKNYGTIPKVECYAGKINQVFMNILNNAVFAVNKKESQDALISISTKEEKNFVMICIKDNGVGIPADVRSKIFDPFFTTKDVGEGTGLGLSIVYNIIETHKGIIKVESEEGVGTEFIIQLPKEQIPYK